MLAVERGSQASSKLLVFVIRVHGVRLRDDQSAEIDRVARSRRGQYN